MEEKTKRLRETGMLVKIYHERLKSPLFHVLHRRAKGYLICRAPRDAWGGAPASIRGQWWFLSRPGLLVGDVTTE